MPVTRSQDVSPTKSPKSIKDTKKAATNIADNSLNDSSNSIDTSHEELQSSVLNSSTTSQDKSLNDTNVNAKRSPQKQKGGKPIKDTPKNLPIKKEQIEKKVDAKDKSYCSFNRLIYTAVFIGLISYSYYMYLDQQNVRMISDPPMLYETFKSDMEHIKPNFPTQTPRFWKTIRVSLKRIIQEDSPDYPAVLLLVVPKGPKASQTGTCIAKRLTKIVNTLFNVTEAKIIDIPTAITHSSPDDEKKDLDNRIKESFENEHLRSIAIDHFEQLSPRASLLFHGYCDGDNAPFKRVAIVFLLHTEFEETYLKDDPTAVDKHLMDLWSNSEFPLDRDKIDPLISRVANNAAIVSEEDNLNCS